MKKIIQSLSTAAVASQLFIAKAFALNDPPTLPGVIEGDTDIKVTVVNLLVKVLDYVTLIGVVFVVVAGIRLIVSGGDEGEKDKAKKTVSETRSELVELTEMVERHEIILAPWQRGETKGNRPKSRFDNIEDELVGMRADMDQTAAASADALAIARSIQGGPSLWAVAIVTFVVAFVIMVVAAIFSPLTIFWDAVLVAFGTTVFVTVAAAILDHLMPSASESIAQARAKAQARRGQENDDVVPGLAEHTPPPKMSAAEAEASARVAARR